MASFTDFFSIFALMKPLVCFLSVLLPLLVQAQLTIRVNAWPLNTTQPVQIYAAGNFNGWNPASAAHKLSAQGAGYTLTIQPAAGLIEFKFTQGSWATVEGNATGGFLPNRTYNYTGGVDTLNLTIASWEGQGSNSTAAPNVQIWNNSYSIPQLNLNRRIWVYLPPDYTTSNKYYPVLYMQDGQNLFDNATAFSGEWQVDETLNNLFNNEGDYGCIVVGIDNGGANRINEYAPWVNTSYNAGGQGAAYVDFIVQTLKPHIDMTFRTLPGRDATGVMGSSLGALISHYAVIKYQNTFSKVGDFSSAFWFNPQIFDFTTTTGKTAPMRFYLLVGGNEEASDNVVVQTQNMNTTLSDIGFADNERNYQYRANGTHSESFWRQEFGAAYKWLFADLNVATQMPVLPDFVVMPNPADTGFTLSRCLPSGFVRIFNPAGQMISEQTFSTSSHVFQSSNLPAGIYRLQQFDPNGQLIGSTSFIVQH
jgi:predicted alpha/beta superfamily hydrolase